MCTEEQTEGQSRWRWVHPTLWLRTALLVLVLHILSSPLHQQVSSLLHHLQHCLLQPTDHINLLGGREREREREKEREREVKKRGGGTA